MARAKMTSASMSLMFIEYIDPEGRIMQVAIKK
jgi:hypothetical protein